LPLGAYSWNILVLISGVLYTLGGINLEDKYWRSKEIDATRSTLEFGKDWKGMLNYLAESESVVDVYLCSSAYGHADDREEMVAETHGVRIIYVGENYFIVGPRRPVHSSVIPMGWISMIRIHEDEQSSDFVSLVPEEDSQEETADDSLSVM
jgi:hypothetical protein